LGWHQIQWIREDPIWSDPFRRQEYEELYGVCLRMFQNNFIQSSKL
jgi:hypothetical protein